MKRHVKKIAMTGMAITLGLTSVNLFANDRNKPIEVSAVAPKVNGTMMQYFEWYLPNDGQLWNKMNKEARQLSDTGITGLWIPPAYKGSSQDDVGYGVYDMYDLGEFNQKGTVRTKYGTKAELKAAIDSAHANGIAVYGDTVMNHRMGADGVEQAPAVEVNGSNRNQVTSGNYNVGAWTSFTFPGRQTDPGKSTKFQWKWWHFDGVDYNNNNGQNKIFRFDSTGKGWDWEVDAENGNYDYLMGADLDFSHPEVQQEMKDWGEWYRKELNLDGYRLDAVKHIQFQYLQDWTNYQRQKAGKDLFTVGEYWSPDYKKLDNFQNKTGNTMSLFDAPLHYNFRAASTSDGNYDLRTLKDNTMMGYNPTKAVTLVDNHDTQTGQALQSEVLDWFKPQAYNYILLHESGYPSVFYKDYYNSEYGSEIQRLVNIRKKYAYGVEHTYRDTATNADTADLVGWTREGDSEHPHSGLAALISDRGEETQTKWMEVGKQHAGEIWGDYTGHVRRTITINEDGWGEFKVHGSSQSAWAPVSENHEPELFGLNDVTINENEQIDLKNGITATDAEDGDMTSRIEVLDTVDTSKAGRYSVRYRVVDYDGRSTVQTRIIMVINGKSTPTLIIYDDPNYADYDNSSLYPENYIVEAYDEKDGDLRDKVKIESHIEYSKWPLPKVGVYPVTFSVTNSAGLTTTVERNIQVKHWRSGPSLECPYEVVVPLGGVYDPLKDAYAADDAGINISSRIKYRGDVNTNVEGTYAVEISIVDDFGLESMIRQTVIVKKM